MLGYNYIKNWSKKYEHHFLAVYGYFLAVVFTPELFIFELVPLVGVLLMAEVFNLVFVGVLLTSLVGVFWLNPYTFFG